jgi:hypothetical protein
MIYSSKTKEPKEAHAVARVTRTQDFENELSPYDQRILSFLRHCFDPDESGSLQRNRNSGNHYFSKALQPGLHGQDDVHVPYDERLEGGEVDME